MLKKGANTFLLLRILFLLAVAFAVSRSVMAFKPVEQVTLEPVTKAIIRTTFLWGCGMSCVFR